MASFFQTQSMFKLPQHIIYLNGNSLGPLPVKAQDAMNNAMVNQWGEMLIGGWNQAGWYEAPLRLGDRIAGLIGAAPDTCVVGDTLSLRMYQAVGTALGLQADKAPAKKLILSDSGNFPTDLYMIQGLLDQLNQGYALKLVEPDQVEEHLDEHVAVLMLTQVDYRTGRLHDMSALTQKAHQLGALAVWDLAHSAGVMEIDLDECEVDFAAGCTYKYLNGGPGAPAFIYCAPRWLGQSRPPLNGWFGHIAPFAFDRDFRYANGMSKFRVGTPPVLQMAALSAALDVFDMTTIAAIRTQSLALSQAFADIADGCDLLERITPTIPEARGSQMSYRPKDGSGIDAYAVVQALIKDKIIGDFRAPNVMRFGFAPLYLSVEQVERAAKALVEIVQTGAWNQPEFLAKKAVT